MHMISGAFLDPRQGQRRRGLVRLGAVVLAAYLSGPPLQAAAEIVDRVVAAVDGEPVTMHDLETWAASRGADEVSAEVLDTYLTERLVAKEAEAQEITASDADVDRYVTEVRTVQGLDDEAFAKALREQGLTLEGYREVVRSEILKSELINREIRARVSVSPEEVRRHYDAHADDYSLAERVRLRMILIAVPPEAPADEQARIEHFVRVLYSEIEGGADFAEMATRYSSGPGAAQGGEVGWFERGQMVKPLEDVAFRLPAGAVSPPVRNSAGYSILKVEAREGHIEQPFEAVSEQIREELYQEHLQRRYAEWIRNGLRKEHHVEVLW